MRDSIWNHVDDSDLTVIRTDGSASQAVAHYLKGRFLSEQPGATLELVTRQTASTFEQFLQRAEEEKIRRISFMPLSNRIYTPRSEKYRRMEQVLAAWQGLYPQEVCFYHLNENDFRYFKNLAASTPL